MLANLAIASLDIIIDKYCKRRNFKYSRYADDITISGSHELPMHKQKIIAIIERSGFAVNEEKTRLHSRGFRQKVTGLVVNDKVSIGRSQKKILRAIVHNILKNGCEIENREKDPFFKEKIFGKLAFAKMVEPDFANPLIKKLKCFNWASYDKQTIDSRESELIIRSLRKKAIINLLMRFKLLNRRVIF